MVQAQIQRQSVVVNVGVVPVKRRRRKVKRQVKKGRGQTEPPPFQSFAVPAPPPPSYYARQSQPSRVYIGADHTFHEGVFAGSQSAPVSVQNIRVPISPTIGIHTQPDGNRADSVRPIPYPVQQPLDTLPDEIGLSSDSVFIPIEEPPIPHDEYVPVPNFDDMTVPQLRDYCKKNSIRIRRGMTKSEIIELCKSITQ